MSKVKILIADDNYRFTSCMKEFLIENGFEVVGIADDGLQVIEMIDTLKPDIVLLDIIMPKLDGLGVLERTYESRKSFKTKFIVFSAIAQDRMVQKALNLGASYFILKPFDLNLLCKRINELNHEELRSKSTGYMDNSYIIENTSNKSNYIETFLVDILKVRNIPEHMTGYKYLMTSILFALENPHDFLPITRKLYPIVANKHDSTPQKVERAIRNSLDSAYKRQRGRPSNSKFIIQVSNELKANREVK